MKKSEIRARLERMKNTVSRRRVAGSAGWQDLDWCVDAIETLLAREAEALLLIKRSHTLSRDDNVNIALWNLLQECRAILNPEGE